MRRNCADRRFPLQVDLEELNANHTDHDGNWWIFFTYFKQLASREACFCYLVYCA